MPETGQFVVHPTRPAFLLVYYHSFLFRYSTPNPLTICVTPTYVCHMYPRPPFLPPYRNVVLTPPPYNTRSMSRVSCRPPLFDPYPTVMPYCLIIVPTDRKRERAPGCETVGIVPFAGGRLPARDDKRPGISDARCR